MKIKGFTTAVLLAGLGLSACGGSAPSISVSSTMAVEYARKALDAARLASGTHDVAPDTVVQAFGAVIASDPLHAWWQAVAVEDMVEVRFRVLSEEYMAEHPDVTYPKVTPGTGGGGHGLGVGEIVEPAAALISAGDDHSSATTTPADPAVEGHGNTDEHTTATTVTSATGDHSTGDHSTGDHSTGDTSTGEKASDGHSSKEGHSSEGGHTAGLADLPEEAFEIAIAACIREIHGEQRARAGRCPVEEAHGDEHALPHWEYADQAGWGKLAKAYERCETGREQSPIDLTGAAVGALVPLSVNYAATAGMATDTGHSLQVDFELGSSITLGEKLYRLVSLHFHADSEHTVGGKSSPLELHFVHKATDGSLAVVGVLVQQGVRNDTWAPLVEALAAATKNGVNVGKLNVQQMLPATPVVYRYQGSLTTPPCSEGVTWSVLTEPVTMSAEQLALLTSRYAANSRDVQPLNERDLLIDARAGS